MKTIGLVGGVASGKSLVAKMLVELGAGLLDGDRVGHAVLAEDGDVQQAIRERWGAAVFAKNGSVDRAAVARIVFGDHSAAKLELQFLENLVHPRIRERLLALQDRFAVEGKPAAVLDAPILLEAGWGSLCDHVLLVDTPRELRLQRACERGWSDEEFARREQAQRPLEEKRRAADVILPNGGSVEELRELVHDFWQKHIAVSQ